MSPNEHVIDIRWDDNWSNYTSSTLWHFTIFLEEEEDEQPGGCCGCCGGGSNKPKKMKLPGVVDEEDSISAQFGFHRVFYSLFYVSDVGDFMTLSAKICEWQM